MSSAPRHVTIATAGHVDHGKSSLVRALTGVDPDRLPEERRRSMTIELGYASLPRPDGGAVAIVDVPGHERLVETMIAGAGGIDAALLVVAADDGPMPQTLEHLRILELLRVRRIVVALSRTDLVDPEWLPLVAAETASLLLGHGFVDIPIFPVSSRTGAGVDALRSCLQTIQQERRPRPIDGAAWLPIDRVFTQPGFGTVVAGTLVSGQLHVGAAVAVEPAGIRAIIRRVESQGVSVASVGPGQRVAVNLPGIERSGVARGDVLSDRVIPLTSFADVLLRLPADAPAPIASGQAVRVFAGTARRNARVRLMGAQRLAPGEEGLAEIVFDRPLALQSDDVVILRRASPAATLGGGIVLARHPTRPRGSRRERVPALAALAVGDPIPELRRRLSGEPITMSMLTADLPGKFEDILETWLRDGSVAPVDEPNPTGSLPNPTEKVVGRDVWYAFIAHLVAQLADVHAASPQAPGVSLSRVRSSIGWSPEATEAMIGAAVRRGFIGQTGSFVHLPHHRARLSAGSRQLADAWLAEIDRQPAGRAILTVGLDPDELSILVRDGELVHLRDARFMTSRSFDGIGLSVLEQIEGRGWVELSAFRVAHGVGRDAAQRLLECLDELGVTMRAADRRVMGPGASAWKAAAMEREAGRSAGPASSGSVR